jgi:hypothetical protein
LHTPVKLFIVSPSGQEFSRHFLVDALKRPIKRPRIAVIEKTYHLRFHGTIARIEPVPLQHRS